MQMEKFPHVHKIAVLRCTAIGDYVAATPALYALRAAYPDAEIVYLGKPWHKDYIEARPGPIDRVIVIPPKPGVRDEPDMREDSEELDAFFAQMREEQFDLAVQLHGGGRNTNPFVKRLGARHTVGSRTPDAEELDRWLPYLFYQPEIMRLLDVVRLTGAEPCRWEPRIEVAAKDYAEVAEKIPQLTSAYAVLHPGASDHRRRWPAERFAQIGDALAERGLQVVVSGTGIEREEAQEVVARMRHHAINTCEHLSLSGLTGLLSVASVMVSNDTGPMHLANALGTPNVGIFWVGNYMNWAHLGRAIHRPIPAFVTHCPHCGQDMTQEHFEPTHCAHDACFVESVSVDDVMTAALEVLAYRERVEHSFA